MMHTLRANSDMKLLIDYNQVLAYITKYVSKSEVQSEYLKLITTELA